MKWNVESAEWFVKPEMMGHIWARTTAEQVKAWWTKNVKTTEQKALAEYCLAINSVDWHYWCNHITKKSLSQLQYVLRRLGKESYVNLLDHLNRTSSCLKDKLNWWLEMKSYETEQDEYFKRIYFPTFNFYGMKLAECQERFHHYHKGLQEKHPIPA